MRFFHLLVIEVRDTNWVAPSLAADVKQNGRVSVNESGKSMYGLLGFDTNVSEVEF
jgi:hypothetical protein